MHDSALHEGYGNGWDEDEPLYQDPEEIEFGTLLLQDDCLSYWNGICWERIVEDNSNALSEEDDVLSYLKEELLAKSKEELLDHLFREIENNTLNEEMFCSKLEEWESFGITPEQLDLLLDRVEYYTDKIQALGSLFEHVKKDYLQSKGWKLVAVSPDALKMLNTLSEDDRYAWKLIKDEETSYLYLEP
jgi:hypothetical protein